MLKKRFVSLLFILMLMQYGATAQGFVQRKQHQFFLEGKPYYYIGTNYWYGSVLALEKDPVRGVERLRKELDFLKSKGINNLRVMAGAEGSGMIHGVQRVGPPLQTTKGNFDAGVLKGLDILLDEMNKREMKAVLFFSNNWEWSGGFLQYLNWNGLIADSVLRRKLSWDEMRDYVSKFYTCTPCKQDYLEQVAFIVNRTNTITGKKYVNDPAIMSWELANEPRPMRPSSNEAYLKWTGEVAAFIKSKDKNHLVTTGHEGEMGTESLELFEKVHADKNIDYLTIHIWPKNWSWFNPATMEKDFPGVISRTEQYIDKHITVAQRLKKPLVIEEFGIPRDHHSFDITATTTLRDQYYKKIFDYWKQHATTNGVLAGANFWAFNGIARPIAGQTYWKAGDDYMGDPPMEEQGLNGVFDTDTSTWGAVYDYTSSVLPQKISNLPADKKATAATVNLYRNLWKLMDKGIMFGHQDDLAYGVDWRYEKGKSDVKELTGDYPAVYGWELGNLEHGLPYNLDSVPFDAMKQFIHEGHQRGGVITLSWHNDHPLTNGSSWDTSGGGVASVLPGGVKHELYKTWLDRLAVFLKDLKDRQGNYIPVLFRPYHELTGNWFWWTKHATSPAEYKLLWRFTMQYLQQEKNIHHLLYVYNTADFNSKASFLEYYPGDDVVDLISFDSYQHGDASHSESFSKSIDRKLSILGEVAKERNKIPTIGETGYEKIPDANWWTGTLWKAMEKHRISYVLIWRNHGLQPNGNWHYYVPKKHDISSEDFKKFYNLDRTLFQNDVSKEKLYQ